MTRGVRKLFSEVPETYELVNHILTVGLDMRWRKRAAAIGAGGGGTRWLDICSGTGETARDLVRLAAAGTLVVAADFSPPMLEKAAAKPEAARLALLLTRAATLPFPSGCSISCWEITARKALAN